jgi:hypothetical protein
MKSSHSADAGFPPKEKAKKEISNAGDDHLITVLSGPAMNGTAEKGSFHSLPYLRLRAICNPIPIEFLNLVH